MEKDMRKINFDKYQRQREDFYKNVENIIEGLKVEPHIYTIMLYPTLEKGSTYQEVSVYKQTERVLSIETCSSYFIMYDPKSKLEIVIRANTDMEEKKRLQYAVSETYSEKEDAMVGINVYVGDDGAYVSERFIQQINIIDDEQGVFNINSKVDSLEDDEISDYSEHEELTEEEILEDSAYDEEFEEYNDSDIEDDKESEEMQKMVETFQILRNGIDISKTLSSEEINNIMIGNINFGKQITEDFEYTIQIIQDIRDQIRRRLRMFSKPRNNHKEDKEK